MCFLFYTKYIFIHKIMCKTIVIGGINIKKILTKRETEVFELLIKNKTTKEIAEELNISEKTIRNHISNAMQKLEVKGRASAVIELLRLGELKL